MQKIKMLFILAEIVSYSHFCTKLQIDLLMSDQVHISTEPLCNKSNHYANTPMQYTTIFHGSKSVNFQMKKFNIFLIFAQNIDCGYTLEPPH